MVSLNNLYILKSLDLFRYDVQLRVQRSKEGGASDHKIGSWFGVFCSFCLTVMVISYMGSKWTTVIEYKDTKYNVIEMKNNFEKNANGETVESGNILIQDYTFLPSIDSKL